VELRSYQNASITHLEQSPHRRSILVAPTGSGKTVIASEIIRQAENKHCLFLAHRRELIHQTKTKLGEFDVKAGVILAGEQVDNMRGVQVASIQTLWSRCFRGKQDLPPADLMFVDECHHAPANTYRKIIAAYPEARIIGMTATPCRGDGRGLGRDYDDLIEVADVQTLIDCGFLVKTRVFAPTTPDLRGVHNRMGDYVLGELADRVDRAELVGDIVTHWHRLADGRKTVVFATNVAHSIHIRDEFVKSGVRAEHIDGYTPKDQRDEILKRLSDGDLDVVSNCMVLTEGWDQPDVGCLVLARPTKSHGLFRQMVGRGLRPFPGKEHCLVLDHAGCTLQHGFGEEPVIWTLDPDKKPKTPIHAARSAKATSRLLECTRWRAIRTAGKACPECGFLPKRPGQHLDFIDGDLAELDAEYGQKGAAFTPEQRIDFQRMLTAIAQERGYKPGWVGFKYREKFGSWPVTRNVPPLTPHATVRAWVRSRQIAFAKSRAA
jgi:superfamily II DNA or RNA helicase